VQNTQPEGRSVDPGIVGIEDPVQSAQAVEAEVRGEIEVLGDAETVFHNRSPLQKAEKIDVEVAARHGGIIPCLHRYGHRRAFRCLFDDLLHICHLHDIDGSILRLDLDSMLGVLFGFDDLSRDDLSVDQIHHVYGFLSANGRDRQNQQNQ
jgi:hypothetical protein